MRLLVHACCGPCLLAPARALAAEGHELVVYWYNPNIQPYREYRRRLAALREVAAREGYRLAVDDRYDPDFFLRTVIPGREGRCPACYAERLGRAAARARAESCDAVTTTLLASRYQAQDELAAALVSAAAAAGVEPLVRDFRPYDAASHALARELGIYVQGYCGCIYSEEERYRRGRVPRREAGGSDVEVGD